MRVKWAGLTVFAPNEAELEGGAITSAPLDSSADGDLVSYLFMVGSTTFIDNVCSRDGRAIALQGGLIIDFNRSRNTVFLRNKARVAGGAVFMSGANIGPRFDGVSFISNFVELRGCVYATSKGNAKIDIIG